MNNREALIARWLTNQQFHPMDVKATIEWYEETFAKGHDPANSEIRKKALEFAEQSKAKWMMAWVNRVPLWQISLYAFGGSLAAALVVETVKWLMN